MRHESDEYFAKKDAYGLIAKVNEHMQMWGANTASSSVFTSILAAYWRNIAAYYSCLVAPDSWLTSLGFGGEQGELVKMAVPLARTLIRQFVSVVTKQRLSAECLTDIDDANPMLTARIGKAICNDVIEKQKLDEKLEKIAERVAVLGMSFVSCTWRTDKGYIHSVSQGADETQPETINYSGGIHIETHDVQEVVFDWSIEDWDNVPWAVIKRISNRWDLIAQYPELRNEVLSIPSVKEVRQSLPNFNFMSRYDDSDMIYVYEFYHKPTPVLPYGRMTVWASEQAVFLDSAEYNPYECIPIIPFKFETIQGTGLGYPMLSSLLPAQEMFDVAMSVIATNQQGFGVQSVLVPKGADIDVNDIQGMNFITYTPANAEGGGKPEAMQLTSTPAEIPNFIKMLENYMGQLSMINSTLRGDPPPNVTSGAMAATLSANAMEFLTSASKAMTFGFEKILNIAMKNYQRFATVEQVVDITGENMFAYSKTFKQEHIKSITKIKVRQQSAMMSTVAGRTQLADSLAQNKMLSNAQKYISIIEGAPVETLFDNELAENTAIQQEVDALLEGKNVIPAAWDNHPMFIQEYRKLLYNQEIRTNSKLMGVLTALIEERVNLEQSMPPDIKALLRGQPLPPPQSPGAPPPGQAMQNMNTQATPGIAAPATAAEPQP